MHLVMFTNISGDVVNVVSSSRVSQNWLGWKVVPNLCTRTGGIFLQQGYLDDLSQSISLSIIRYIPINIPLYPNVSHRFGAKSINFRMSIVGSEPMFLLLPPRQGRREMGTRRCFFVYKTRKTSLTYILQSWPLTVTNGFIMIYNLCYRLQEL